MRTKFLFLALFIVSQPSTAAVKIDQWLTQQGAKVLYVQSQDLPLVDIQVTFDAGSARDGSQYGIAALTSDVLNSGAGAWNADQVAQRFDNVGAKFGIGVSTDSTTVSLRSLTDPALLNPALETLQVVLAKPQFAETDFQLQKNQALAALKQREESPSSLTRLHFYKALYGKHPYAHPTEGNVASVSALTRGDLKAFYQRYYVASNALVVIVGNVDKSQAQQIAEKLLHDLPVGTKPAPLPAVTLPSKAATQMLPFPSSQTHILMGLPTVTRKDEDYVALYVGNHILGGASLVSQLFNEVREKRGLAYSASSYLSPMSQAGAFAVTLQTKNEQSEQALAVVNETVNHFLDNGVSEAELLAAKKNITGGFVLRFDTNSKLAAYVNMIGFYDLPLDYLQSFPQRVEAMTVAQIKEAFKRKIQPSLFQTILVGGKASQK